MLWKASTLEHMQLRNCSLHDSLQRVGKQRVGKQRVGKRACPGPWFDTHYQSEQVTPLAPEPVAPRSRWPPNPLLPRIPWPPNPLAARSVGPRIGNRIGFQIIESKTIGSKLTTFKCFLGSLCLQGVILFELANCSVQYRHRLDRAFRPVNFSTLPA